MLYGKYMQSVPITLQKLEGLCRSTELELAHVKKVRAASFLC